MFAFLTKKISLPGCNKLEVVAWSLEHQWIAVGGEKGFMKVLKLDDLTAKPSENKSAAPATFQLEGHSSKIVIVIWNERYQKLTTCDEKGLLIVWMMHKGSWVEEMINDRHKSFVSAMKWTPDGSRIGICYDDGMMIVGSVEGTRLWGKEFNHRISNVEWSPDGKILLIGTPEGELKVYDSAGNSLNTIKMYCLKDLVAKEKLQNPGMKLIGLQWFELSKMYTENTPAGLVVAYQCGRLQLMKHERDDDPICLDTGLNISQVKWHPKGGFFAVSGEINTDSKTPKSSVIYFYDNEGIFLKSIAMPSTDPVTSISWEGGGLRLAIVGGQYIFTAKIRSTQKWAYLSNATLAFAFQKADRVDFTVIFWDTNTNSKTIKSVRNLISLKASGENCVMITKSEDEDDIWCITLCNSIGNPIDSKFINIYPSFFEISSTHVIVASDSHVYLWQYRSQTSRIASFESVSNSVKKFGREIAWFVDESVQKNAIYDREKYNASSEAKDLISAIDVGESQLLIVKASGECLKFSLPDISLIGKLQLKPEITLVRMNMNNSRLAIIDKFGNFNVYDLMSDGVKLSSFEKKEVWDVKWAEDNPSQYAIMEKQRLILLKDDIAEDPIPTEGYICDFQKLFVKTVLLDDILRLPDVTEASNYLTDHPSNSLKEAQTILEKQNLNEAFDYISNNSHPHLWKLLSDKSLEELNFVVAEKTFLKMENYAGLQILKKMQSLDDKTKQKAEALAFLGKFEAAESLYKKIGRKDLAISMRMRLGDWFNVISLIKEGEGFDEILNMAYDQLGNHYAEKFEWNEASTYYSLAKNYKNLIFSLRKANDFENLRTLAKELPETDKKLFVILGEQLESAGLVEEAVECYEKGGEIKRAIDCCVLLNQWNLAVELAEKHSFVQIEGLLSSYATQLLEKRRLLEATELYRKANRNTDAAKILAQIGNDLIERESPPLIVKKLHVMAALEVESHKKRIFDATMTGQTLATAKTLDTLITSDINSSSEKILNNPWRGAEAWHFYLLAQAQLYQGKFTSALKTSLRVSEYEFELGSRKVYSLIAICAYYAKNFKECSRAFVKLEVSDFSDIEKAKIGELATQIFTKNPPSEPDCERFQCPGKNCNEKITEFDTFCRGCGAHFAACVSSGKPIIAKEYSQCRVCRHKILNSEISSKTLIYCPLCHMPLQPEPSKNSRKVDSN